MNISMQTLRGLAIMAVVLTHAQFDPTQIQANYIIQNLINIGVAGFIFLSGYFTNQQKVKENPLSFIKHRFKRLIIPYIFWTVSYLAFSYIRGTRYSFEEIAREVLLGYGTLYFILVLFYLTLFTPFIVKFKDHKIINILFYAVTPVTLIYCYWHQLEIGPLHFTGARMPTAWFIYYYLGIKMKNYTPTYSTKSLIMLACLGFALEVTETEILSLFTKDTRFAATPLRFTPFVYIISFILIFIKKKDHITKPNALSKIGDLSYGIYLFHIIALAFVAYAVRMLYNMTNPASNSMGISALFYILCVFLIFAITLYVSYYTVKYASKILPVKLLTLIGFQK